MAENTSDKKSSFVIEAAAELVSALAVNPNLKLDPNELQDLIRDTHATILEMVSPKIAVSIEVERPPMKSRADVRKSIGPTHLISFFDGKPYRSLKRHLTANGSAPADYRAQFGLPNDYPITHPDYSRKRSELAKAIGLGGWRRKKASAGAAARSSRGKTDKARNPKAAVD